MRKAFYIFLWLCPYWLSAQSTYKVLLLPTPEDIQTYPFYVDSVVDNRTDKGPLGEVAIGAFNKPAMAVLEGGFENTLLKYLDGICTRKDGQLKVVAFFEFLSISERPPTVAETQSLSLNERGYANVKITFYKRNGSSLERVKTVAVTQLSKKGDVTKGHSERIKAAIRKCLDQLANEINIELQPPKYVFDPNHYENFHGLRQHQTGGQFFEGEGYDIFIRDFDAGLDDQGLSKIRKQLNLKEAKLLTDSVLEISKLTTMSKSGPLTANLNCYLIPTTSKKTTAIGFARSLNPDLSMERGFVASYRINKIPFDVFTPVEIDSVNFVGRYIGLGPACHWMGPHNIQCPDMGQMNWAIFENQEQAETYRDHRIALMKDRDLLNIKEEKMVDLIFEGQKTKALRIKIKIQVPKLVTAGSNVLIAYYVTEQVRGKYVTCILSHYTDDVGANTLPPLLSEVLRLPD